MSSSTTVSANTLFHFTSSLGYLLGILTNNFYPRYCLENHKSFFEEKVESKGIPMVCFCDIPLSNIQNHTAVYGEYAIGLSKDWGKENKINPIMYFLEDSVFVETIKASFTEITQKTTAIQSYTEGKSSPESKFCENSAFGYYGLHNGLMLILSYTKEYIGSATRNDKTTENIRFYDEREWRYVPDLLEMHEDPPSFLSEAECLDSNLKRQRNKQLETSDMALKFGPNDIKYIIVSKETEIPEMIEKIRTIKQPKYTPGEIDLLITRIISLEQISQDF